MKEKIKELWFALGMGIYTYNSHGDDDLGRLNIIEDRIVDLMELKNSLAVLVRDVKHNYYIVD